MVEKTNNNINSLGHIANNPKKDWTNSPADHKATDKVASTFSDVRVSRTTPIQSALTTHLDKAIGDYFVVSGVEYQQTTDFNDENKINHASVYSVRVIKHKAWLPFGTEVRVKIKEQKPVVSEEEIEKLMLGKQKPIVVSFEDLSYFHFGSGETLIAQGIHRLNVDVKEVTD